MEENVTLLNKTVSGAKWMTFGLICERAVNIIAFVTLARMLDPEMYGIMIAATIVVGVAQTMLNPGFGTIAIQEKGNVEEYFNTIWTLEIIKGICLFILIAVLSPFIARFFSIEGYESVICIGGGFLLVRSFMNVGMMLIPKSMEFKKLFIKTVVEQISYITVALTWALLDRSVWALVAGNSALYLSSTISTYFLSSYKPKLDFDFKRLIRFVKKAKWIVGTNIVNYFSGIIDTTFLGYLLGPANMAIYSKARDMSIVPTSYIGQVTSKVVFPAVAKIQDEKNKISDAFIDLINITAFISIPFLLISWFEGERIIHLFLGEKWIGMAEPFKLLVIAMTIRAIIIISNPILYGTGKFHIIFRTMLLQLITIAIFVGVLAPFYGINGAAYGVIASFAVVSIYVLYNMLSFIKDKIIKILQSLGVILLAGSIATGVAMLFYNVIAGIHWAIYLAILSGLGLLYIGLTMLFGKIFKKGPYKIIIGIVKNLA